MQITKLSQTRLNQTNLRFSTPQSCSCKFSRKNNEATLLENNNVIAFTGACKIKSGDSKKFLGMTKHGFLNIKANILTFLTGVVHPNASALKNAETFMSKPVKAYRFDPIGSINEVLARNPGVTVTKKGKYCVLDKPATESLQNAINSGTTLQEAIKSLNLDDSRIVDDLNVFHKIDSSKNPMIIMSDNGYMDVCDGDVFKNSYIHKNVVDSNEVMTHIDPAELQYGQIIDVTKQQASGSFKILPVGTKVKTPKGIQTVNEGQVVVLDSTTGEPYVTAYQNILEWNTKFTKKGLKDLAQLEYGVLSSIAKNKLKQQISSWPEYIRLEAERLIDKNVEGRFHNVYYAPDKFKSDNISIYYKNGYYDGSKVLDEVLIDDDLKTVYYPLFRLKANLLHNRGINTKVEYESIYNCATRIDRIDITEKNGIEHSFCGIKDAEAWMDKKLGLVQT